MLLNFLAADDFSGAFGEHEQYNELLRLEFKSDTALSQLMLIWIQFKGSEMNPAVITLWRAHANLPTGVSMPSYAISRGTV
jgi:hypothetical protein